MLDADTGKVLWTEGKTTTTGRAVDSAVIFPYSKRVLTHRDGQDSMLVLDSATGKLLSEIKVSPSFSWITRYAIDKRADLAIAGNTMGEIVCVELETGATKYRFRTGYGYVKELSITPDGKRFVTVSEITDGRNPIQIWDLASGKLLESLFGSSGGVSFASVHPLSGQLVVENNSRLQARIWATTTTPESWVIPRNGSLCSPTFWNSDNRLFCASEVYPIALYDLSTKRTVWTPPVIQYDQVSVSADGSLAEVLPYPDRSKLQSAILLRISPNGSPT